MTRGGGVLIAANSSLHISRVDCSVLRTNFPSIDVVGNKCLSCHITFYIFVLYIPPDITNLEFGQFFDEFELLLCNIQPDNVIILGDFNTPLFSSTSNDAKSYRIQNLLEFLSISQLNTIPNEYGKTLDLILSNCNCHIFHDNSPLVTEDKHHPALFITFSINKPTSNKFSIELSHRNYNFKKANYPALYNEILTTDWTFLTHFSDVNMACDALYAKFYSILDNHVPYFIPRNNKYPPWYSVELKTIIREKEHYFRQYKKHRREIDLSNFKQKRAISKSLAHRDYKHYVVKCGNSIKNDPKRFWSFVNSKKGQTRIPSLMHHDNTELNNPQSIVDAFSDYFKSVFLQSNGDVDINEDFGININMPHLTIDRLTEDEVALSMKKLKNKMTCGPDRCPSFLIRDCAVVLSRPLTIIFNLSLKQGMFPDIWKSASVCPILKHGDPSDVTNYRPITLLCNFAKVFEMSLYNRIYPVIRPIISIDQHGFMEKRSTNTNLIYFSQFLSNVIDQQGQVDVIYTDFSKAFDRLDHRILLIKMEQFGFSTSLIQLLSSYLTNRSQYVLYNGFHSNIYKVTSGVPQGSNLGPLLFLIFINDLNNQITCQKLLFADDLKIFSPIKTACDCDSLQADLDNLTHWCSLNLLDLNISKCKTITFSRKVTVINYDYHINSETLTRTDSIKDLGIHFDSELSFSSHIELTVKSSMKMLGFVLRLGQDFQDNVVLINLYFAYVRSKLEYCSLVWNPIYACYIDSLESVQRKFLKFLCFRIDGRYPERGYNNISLLNRFNINSLNFRRNFYSIKFLHMLLNNNVDSPNILGQLNFLVPRLNNRRTNTFYNPSAHTNILLKSPIHTMCFNYNSICNVCDIFNCTIYTLFNKFKNISNL